MLWSEVWKKGISIDADYGPPRYVLWCYSGIFQDSIQIGFDHTVAVAHEIFSKI